MSDIEQVEFHPTREWILLTQAWLEASSTEDTVEFADKMAKLRRWMDIQKESQDIRIAALKLECLALRKIGQVFLDNPYAGIKLPPRLKRSALAFGKLSDREFREMMSDIKHPMAPSTVVLMKAREQEQEDLAKRLRDVLAGDMQRPLNVYEHLDVRFAAAKLLSELMLDNTPFTVAEAALQLAQRLEGDPGEDSFWMDEQIQVVLRDIIRRALTEEGAAVRDRPIYTNGEDVQMPRFITYQEEGIGWVRVPWVYASLDQLEAMAKLRRAQVKALDIVASDLEALLVELRDRSKGQAYSTLADLVIESWYRQEQPNTPDN